MRHEIYRDVSHAQNNIYATFRNMHSVLHTLETVKLYEICLSPYDEKRYALNDGVNSLVYGHCSLRNE